MKYNIYLFGRKAVCPKCSGMLADFGGGIQYCCIDCNGIFEVVSTGQIDNEVVCKLITREEVAQE